MTDVTNIMNDSGYRFHFLAHEPVFEKQTELAKNGINQTELVKVFPVGMFASLFAHPFGAADLPAWFWSLRSISMGLAPRSATPTGTATQ